MIDGAEPLPSSGSSQSFEEVEESTQGAPVQRKNGTTPRQARALKQEDYSLYADGVQKSHLLKLQIDDLVTQLRPNYEKRANSIDSALRVLKHSIEAIEDREPVSVCLDSQIQLHMLIA